MSLLLAGVIASCTFIASDYSSPCGSSFPPTGTSFSASITDTSASLTLGERTYSFDPDTIYLEPTAASASYLDAGSGSYSGYSVQFFSPTRGVFLLFSGDDSGETDVRYTLASSVSEPSTWITFLLGFGLLGATLRRRQYCPNPL